MEDQVRARSTVGEGASDDLSDLSFPSDAGEHHASPCELHASLLPHAANYRTRPLGMKYV
jgi:hypothetical protein